MNNDFEELEQCDYIDSDYLEEVQSKYSSVIGEFMIDFSYLEHEINLAIADIIHDDMHETG